MWLEPHRKIPNTQIRVYSYRYRLLQRGFMNNSYTLIACFSRTLLNQEYYQPSPAPPPPPNKYQEYRTLTKSNCRNWMMTFHYSFFTCNKIHFHVIIILRFTQLNIYSTVSESKPYAIAQNQPEHAKRITDMSKNPKICLIMWMKYLCWLNKQMLNLHNKEHRHLCLSVWLYLL